jgi:hypothetical protein
LADTKSARLDISRRDGLRVGTGVDPIILRPVTISRNDIVVRNPEGI